MARIEQRFYSNVPALTVQTSDYIIPDGFSLQLEEMGGNSVQDPQGIVQIIWDPAGTNELLLATAGDIVQRTFKKFAGNGVKVVRIRLQNNDVSARYLGGYFFGRTS